MITQQTKGHARCCSGRKRQAAKPEGIHVIEAEPTLLIKTKHTQAANALSKKLTGQCIGQYTIYALSDLIKNIFCEGEKAEYEYNGDNGTGNTDAEHYPFRYGLLTFTWTTYINMKIK